MIRRAFARIVEWLSTPTLAGPPPPRPLTLSYPVEGRPLSDVGLEGLWVRYPTGIVKPFTGLWIYSGETIPDALQRYCERHNCAIFTDEKGAREYKP